MIRFFFWGFVTSLASIGVVALIGLDYLDTIPEGRAIAIICSLAALNFLGYMQGRTHPAN